MYFTNAEHERGKKNLNFKSHLKIIEDNGSRFLFFKESKYSGILIIKNEILRSHWNKEQDSHWNGSWDFFQVAN